MRVTKALNWHLDNAVIYKESPKLEVSDICWIGIAALL